MSWFTSKPVAPSNQNVRQQEIGIFQRTVRDLQWVAPDETCLKIIRLGSLQFTLSIHVPRDYPQKPPVLRLLTPATHPWLDTQGFFTLCPAVTNWSPNSPSLVSLIQFIETKFREQPPTPGPGYQQQQHQQQPLQQSSYSPNNNSSPYGSSTTTNPYQSNTNLYQSQNGPPQLNQQNSYIPPLPNNSGGYTPQLPPGQVNRPSYQPPPQQSPMHQSMSQSSFSQQSPSGQQRSSISGPPVQQQQQQPPPPQQQQPEEPALKFKSTNISRPQQPSVPPEPPIQLAPIPQNPPFDRTKLSKLTLQQLEELDGDVEKIKLEVAQHPIISQMYENLLTQQAEIDELESAQQQSLQASQPKQAELDAMKENVIQREKEFQSLKQQFEAKLKEFDVNTYLQDLHQQLSKLDDDAEDLTIKFSNKRNPGEEELLNFLDSYEANRQEYHIKSIILQRLKRNLART